MRSPRHPLAALAAIALLLLTATHAAPTHAQSVVRCESIKNRFNECDAPWRSARLIEQSSRAPCVAGNSWGFNATTRRLWVSQGCRGIFTYGTPVRSSSNRNADEVAAGVTAAALAAAIAEEDRKERERLRREREREANAYNGCHGIGCYVDNPDAAVDGYVDPATEPMMEPNFEGHGDYNGCTDCYISPPNLH